MIGAVVPVKSLGTAKSRLFPGRSHAERAELCLAMMEDVIACLRAVPAIARVCVVTPDAAVEERARAAGAETLRWPEEGLNPAVEAATRALAPGAGDGVLVVLGDVAAADPAEIAQLLEAAPERGVALAPSDDGGTSALLRRPADVVPARFGPDSAARHREAAAAADVPALELALPSLAIDIDLHEDARAIRRVPTLGPRTRALLERWEREAPPHRRGSAA